MRCLDSGTNTSTFLPLVFADSFLSVTSFQLSKLKPLLALSQLPYGSYSVLSISKAPYWLGSATEASLLKWKWYLWYLVKFSSTAVSHSMSKQPHTLPPCLTCWDLQKCLCPCQVGVGRRMASTFKVRKTNGLSLPVKWAGDRREPVNGELQHMTPIQILQFLYHALLQAVEHALSKHSPKVHISTDMFLVGG